MKTHKHIGAIAFFVLTIVQANAQQIHQSMASGGGDASGATGSVSYTIGQIFYTTTAGPTGSSATGIQTTVNLGNPLPVKLRSFAGECISGKVHLNWQTVIEIDNDFFVAEKSADAKVWTSIATIKGGKESRSYSCVDDQPTTPVSYYRLKQVDIDGTYTYSRMINVLSCKSEAKAIALYPNPTSTGVYLAMEESENADYELYNLKGNLMHKDKIQNSKTYIDMSAWALGAYVLKMRQNNFIINTISIIKN